MNGHDAAGPVLRMALGDDEVLSREIDLADRRGWDQAIAALRANVVLVRVATRAASVGREPPLLASAARTERARVADGVELVRKVTRAVEEAGATYVLTKAFQHYPDMGHDLDLFVAETNHRIDGVLEHTMSARRIPTSLLARFAGKSSLEVPAYSMPVEVHHGRLGLAGQHLGFARALASRRGRRAVADLEVFVPSAEDQLVLQAIQRISDHRLVRASDALLTIDLAARADWSAVARIARQAGVAHALVIYASFVQVLHRTATGPALHMPVALRAIALPEPGPAGHRVPALLVAEAYAATALSRAAALDLEALARIAALPFLAAISALARAAPPRRRRGSRG